ncbi:aminopeptidase [Candidatus Saccharibacteria bacterium]|nr:aminopeptidase [Candidatus Saccharibacteria bacterium]
MSYVPSNNILEKYAKVLVNFALDSGKGIKPDDVIYLHSPLSALPLYRTLRKVIIDSGGHIISNLSDDMSGGARYFYENATDEQLNGFLEKYARGLVDQVDHRIALISNYDIHELDGVNPRRILTSQKAMKPLMKWFDEKENSGRYTWTLALYATQSQAKEADLSLKEYWQQIIHACYLDYEDPLEQWRKASDEITRVSTKLTSLKIEELHMKGNDVDLHVRLGPDREWLGGSGRNIPSFEIFTSPDWRGTDGWIRFNQPWYSYGSVVKGIELHFKEGRVTSASAKQNEKLLKEMLTTDEGASQLGEYSLTDKRLSRIDKFMANTLFDENIGGPFGNTHIAVGKSYHDTFSGNVRNVSAKTLEKLGFNESAVHNDLISTSDRVVTAILPGGERRIIYKNGQFEV